MCIRDRIVLVLAVRSAFLGAVLALVLLSIFRIILVGLFLCVIVLGHSALLFSPLLFSMKIKMRQMIFVAQERLSIPAAITVSPAFTDTSIDALRANYTHRLSRKNFLSPVGEFFPTAVVRSALFRIVGFLFADLVNIPPHFLFEIPPQSDMRVPFFLRIEAITPFDVQHPLFYVKHRCV